MNLNPKWLQPTLLYRTTRREYWVKFDPDAEVFEMFASKACDDYLGSFDDWSEAMRYATSHEREMA